MAVAIPEGSIEIQSGLFAILVPLIFNGIDRSHYNIHSSDGYCFYNVNQPENYDEDGNLKPENQRVYLRVCYTAYRNIDDLNANFVSVPIKDEYEIV